MRRGKLAEGGFALICCDVYALDPGCKSAGLGLKHGYERVWSLRVVILGQTMPSLGFESSLLYAKFWLGIGEQTLLVVEFGLWI